MTGRRLYRRPNTLTESAGIALIVWALAILGISLVVILVGVWAWVS